MSKKALWITVGPPGCGKTGYIIRNSIFNSVHVSRDAIRMKLLASKDKYYDLEEEIFERFVEEINEAFKRSDTVYADAAHLNENSRNKLLDRLDLTDITLFALYFDVPLEECLRKNAQREEKARVPENNIIRMYNHLTDPTFDKKYKYIVHHITKRVE